MALSFSLFLHLQKRFGSRPDLNGIRKECFVNLKICACDRKYAKCRTKANAHDKMGFLYISISVYIVRSHARIQRGGQGVRTPLKNHKNIEFLSNTGPDPLNFSKLSSQQSTLGHHRHAFKWRFTGGPMMARF